VEQTREELHAYQTRRSRRGWRAIWTHVSAVPDVLYPYDPAVWRAIREFDPNTIVLMTKRAYQAPTGEERVLRFHTLSSHRWNPDQPPDPALKAVLTPTWCNMPQPTHIDLHLENRRARRGDGLPGEYIPFDWRVYYALRSSYQEWTGAQIERFLAENDAAAQAQKRREAAEARVQERFRKEGARLMEHWSRIDKHDAERLIAKAIAEAEPKPMVTIA
jgi:hypothetical protein